MTAILGIVTIGQTPRPDLADAFGAEAPHAEVRVSGALDGIGNDDLAALQNLTTSSEYPLLVRLSSGAHIEVPLDRLVPRVTSAARRLAADGALSRTRRVGIITPNRAQVPYAERKWRADGFEPTVTWASPSRDDEMVRAADELRGADLDLIVIDCMGHADDARRVMARRTGRLVIAAQSVVAKVAGATI